MFRRDATQFSILIAKFQQRFRETQWPENIRLPDVFYDPRPLAAEEVGKSACLHAKLAVGLETTCRRKSEHRSGGEIFKRSLSLCCFGHVTGVVRASHEWT